MTCWKCREYASEEAKKAMQSYMKQAQDLAIQAANKAAERLKQKRKA